jgi:serine/threonine protein kinase
VELVRQLGRQVWLVEHAVYGRVVYKRVDLREARITEMANCVVATGGNHIILPFVDAEPLDERIRRQGHLEVRDALAIATMLARTLGALHARGIVHRDVKPENVVGTTLVDFGSAHAPGEAAAPPSGTPAYMAPEQLAGDVDPRVDVYALGCVLFAMLVGRPPFLGSRRQLIAQHVGSAPPRLANVLARVSPALDALVARCLAKDPAARFASGTELAAALARIDDRAVYPLVAPKLPSATTTLSASALAVETCAERRLSRTTVALSLLAAAVWLAITGVRIANRAGDGEPAPVAAARPIAACQR